MLSLFEHIIQPMFWGVGSYAGLRLLIRLGRRFGLISGLNVLGQFLALSAAALVGLWSDQQLEHWPLLTKILQTIVTVSIIAVVLHIGDQLLVRRLAANGRPNAIPRLMRDIARGFVLLMTLLICIGHFFQVQIGTVLLSSTVFTAVVGLALQDLLKNVIAGIALQMERPFMPGDWIFIDAQTGYGRVLEMSWRAIRVKPRDGQVVVIPNTIIAQQQIINMSATGLPVAMRVAVTVDCVHPPMMVRELLKEAVLSSRGVVAQPEPFVFVRNYTAFSTTYEVKCWISNYDDFPQLQGDALSRIWYVFQRQGIHFASNEMVLTRPEQASRQRRLDYTPEQIFERLRRIKLLDGLHEQELRFLSENVEIRLFERGEILAHQGRHEHILYAITRGKVRVEVAHDDQPPLVVSHLGAGDVFGERGMLMDEPRSASVIAEEDTRTIVIERHDLAPLYAKNPSLAERLGVMVAERQQATHNYLEQQRSVNQSATPSPAARSITERIRDVLIDLSK
ncbi:mechanosensitive ion channel family protein [Herpetosiphon geysericola]|uniref:Cyclic nucleotide-binding domain-containing protein n=1 Tax=Herpetosiphon geysericola TaxID=70996 RepID=A0A0P6Y7X3_9CHLR|nr:mechanosensitive ion channel family protein [Herpetosiphon geysericola]KPL88918.1 hypothetical protein SE18_09650 [Herpetosiphon geysericola]